MLRRDFLSRMSQAVFAYATSSDLAEKAAEAMQEIFKLNQGAAVPTMNLIDAMATAMSGESLAPYKKLLARVEYALSPRNSLTASEVISAIQELKTNSATILSMQADFTTAYQQYIPGTPIAEIFSNPATQKAVSNYLDVNFAAFNNVDSATKETLKILQMQPAQRAAYLDKKLGISKMQEKTTNLLARINTISLNPDNIKYHLKDVCEVWPKVRGNDEHGYNIKVTRLPPKDGQLASAESYSEWESRTKNIAAAITKNLPGATVKHNRFQQGRIIVLTEEGSDADLYFKDFNSKQNAKVTPRFSFKR